MKETEDNDDVNSGVETTKSVEVQAANSMSSDEVQTDLNLIVQLLLSKTVSRH